MRDTWRRTLPPDGRRSLETLTATLIGETSTSATNSDIFPLEAWRTRLPGLAASYQSAKPVPHIYLPNMLAAQAAIEAADDFPDASTSAWTHYQHQNENKHGMTKRELFPSRLGEVCDALNSPSFVEWLSELTGIENLMADPTLEGGGLHQSGRGGFLNVHTDFSHHHYNTHWKRRINLIVYLNEDWQQDWGGALELWDSEMKHCVVKYPPAFNTAIIFNTDEKSYHGFPEPLQCPQNRNRKSLALYYYTLDTNKRSPQRSTNYRARPEDGALKAAMIWIDKQAVHYYSKAKAKFGFSDEIASRLLDRFSRRK